MHEFAEFRGTRWLKLSQTPRAFCSPSKLPNSSKKVPHTTTLQTTGCNVVTWPVMGMLAIHSVRAGYLVKTILHDPAIQRWNPNSWFVNLPPRKNVTRQCGSRAMVSLQEIAWSIANEWSHANPFLSLLSLKPAWEHHSREKVAGSEAPSQSRVTCHRCHMSDLSCPSSWSIFAFFAHFNIFNAIALMHWQSPWFHLLVCSSCLLHPLVFEWKASVMRSIPTCWI